MQKRRKYMSKNKKIAIVTTLGIVALLAAVADDLVMKPATVTHPWMESAAMNTARSESCSAVLANGKVLVTGGADADGVLTGAEVYDLNGGFTPGSPLMNPRQSHVFAPLPTGLLLVAGSRAN